MLAFFHLFMSARLFNYHQSAEELQTTIMRSFFNSLSYLSEHLGGTNALEYKNIAAAKNILKRHPLLFVRYLDLVNAVETNNQDSITKCADLVKETCQQTSELKICNYSKVDLGEDYGKIANILFGTSYGTQPIVELSEQEFRTSKEIYTEALELVNKYHILAAAEIDAFWSRVYLGKSNKENGATGFGGVSSLMVWGGAFANAKHYQDLLQAADFFVHESTHALLFALSHEEPLVLNNITDVYPSPLRSDPRPMDGIFHASLVCARVCEFYYLLAQDDDSESKDKIIQLSQRNKASFYDGLTTIQKDGLLSAQAKELVDQADCILSDLS